LGPGRSKLSRRGPGAWAKPWSREPRRRSKRAREKKEPEPGRRRAKQRAR